MLASDQGLPATRMQEILGGSYKSAWFLAHRIRAAMSDGFDQPDAQVSRVGELPNEMPLSEGNRALLRSEWCTADAPPSWILLRRLGAGTYSRSTSKHLAAYWNEVRWRDRNRDNPNAFRDTVDALLHHAPLSYDELTMPCEGRVWSRLTVPATQMLAPSLKRPESRESQRDTTPVAASDRRRSPLTTVEETDTSSDLQLRGSCVLRDQIDTSKNGASYRHESKSHNLRRQKPAQPMAAEPPPKRRLATQR